jgi:hypothetical protein
VSSSEGEYKKVRPTSAIIFDLSHFFLMLVIFWSSFWLIVRSLNGEGSQDDLILGILGMVYVCGRLAYDIHVGKYPTYSFQLVRR